MAIVLLVGLTLPPDDGRAQGTADEMTMVLNSMEELGPRQEEAVKAGLVETIPTGEHVGELQARGNVTLSPATQALLGEVNNVRRKFFHLQIADKTGGGELGARRSFAKSQIDQEAKMRTSDSETRLLRIMATPGIADRLFDPLLRGFLAARGYENIQKISSANGYVFQANKPEGTAKESVTVDYASNAAAYQGLAAGACDLAVTTRPATETEDDTLFKHPRNNRPSLGSMKLPGYVSVIALEAFTLVAHGSEVPDKIPLSRLGEMIEGKNSRATFIRYARETDRDDLDDFLRLRLGFNDPKASFSTALPGLLVKSVAEHDSSFALLAGSDIKSLPAGVRKVSISSNSLSDAPALAAEEVNIRTEDYALTRQVRLCTTRNRPIVVKQLRDYAAGKGQESIKLTGFTGQGAVDPKDVEKWYRAADMAARYRGRSEYDGYIKLIDGCDRADTPFVLHFLPDKDDVQFYTNLNPSALQDVRVLVNQIARQRQAAPIVLIGHTDSDGTPQYNKSLGVRRARSVRNELVSMGLTVEEVADANSMGKSMAIALNNTPEGKESNRRVELWLRRGAP